MAFCCLQHLRLRLAVQTHPMSPACIQRALNGLQFSILTVRGWRKQYALPSRATSDAQRIYRLLGLRWNEVLFQIDDPPLKARKRGVLRGARANVVPFRKFGA